MINAAVFYGTLETPSLTLFKKGCSLFTELGISEYKITLQRMNRLGYTVSKEVSEEELLTLFGQEEFNYIISFSDKGDEVYFCQTVRSVGPGNTVKLGGWKESELSKAFIDALMKTLASESQCQYGFSFQAINALKAQNYVIDSGSMTVAKYDSARKWQRHFTYCKDDSDYGQRLRLVYCDNYLNAHQLSTLHIDGVALATWIAESDSRGVLNPIDDNLTHWQVPEAMLEEVNHQCGDAGLSISFVKPIVVVRSEQFSDLRG